MRRVPVERNLRIEDFYELVMSKGDLDIIDELVSPHFVDRTRMHGQQPGIQGLKQSVTILRNLVPDLRFKVASMSAVEKWTVVRWTALGTPVTPLDPPVWFLGETELIGTGAENPSRMNRLRKLFVGPSMKASSMKQIGSHLLKFGVDDKIVALWTIRVEDADDMEQTTEGDSDWPGAVGPPPPGPPWIPPEPEPKEG